MSAPAVLRVTDVFGGRCYVLAERYERCRHAVPLVTRDGRDIRDTARWKPGMCSMILRVNIASVRPA